MHVDSDDIEWIEPNTGEEETTFRRKQLSAAADGEHIGCSLYELPPDKRSWPYHYHEGNDEAIYVLSGTGSVRLKNGTHAVSAGDYVYPDMNKLGVYTGTPPGRHEGRKLTKYYPEDADVDYWSDESDPD